MLERFLEDVDQLRDDLSSAPYVRRAVMVRADLTGGASTDPTWGSRTFSVHIFDSASPSRRDRAAWSFPVDRYEQLDRNRSGVADVRGWLEPGRAVMIVLDEFAVWAAGPLRPTFIGARWRS